MRHILDLLVVKLIKINTIQNYSRCFREKYFILNAKRKDSLSCLNHIYLKLNLADTRNDQNNNNNNKEKKIKKKKK